MVQSVLYWMYAGTQFWKVFLLVVESVVVVVVAVVVVVVVVLAALKKGVLGATCNFVIHICLPSVEQLAALLVVDFHRGSMDGIPQLSNEKNLGWLFDRGDYTTQIYGDYNKAF